MEPPQDPPPPTRSGSLRRSESDRYLGGVAGGIAARFAIDPVFVRTGLVGATLYLAYADGGDLHPLVLVPYALLWAVLPTASTRALITRIRDRDARRELLLASIVVVLGLVLLVRPASIIVLGLAALAAALLRDPAPAPESSSGPWPPDAADAEDVEAATGPTWSPRRLMSRRTSAYPPPRPRREPALWPLTFGLLVLVFTVALAMDQATSGRVDPRIVVDVALLVVGGVLLLSAWRGRARITLLALAALLPLWIATSVADVGRFSGEGTMSVRPDTIPTSAAGGPGPVLSYEVGYGRLDVDLRELPLGPGDVITVDVGVTAGRATVTVPFDVDVRVRGDIGLGTIDVSAPEHYLSDADPAVNRSFDRSYPALGTECYQVEVSEQELADLADGAGIRTTDAQGALLPSEEIADAIAAAGYPRPTVGRIEPFEGVAGDGEVVFDEFGNPVTTTSLRDDARSSVVSYWNVPIGWRDFELCRPSPPPTNPVTIVLEPTIGFGTLEIERV